MLRQCELSQYPYHVWSSIINNHLYCMTVSVLARGWLNSVILKVFASLFSSISAVIAGAAAVEGVVEVDVVGLLEGSRVTVALVSLEASKR